LADRRGFTLMELMVVMSIFTLVSGIAYTALRLNDNYKDMILVKNDLYHNCKRAMDSIVDELQKSRADDLTIINGVTGGHNTDSIRFRIPLIETAVAPDYNVQWGAYYPDNPDPNHPDYYIRFSLWGTERGTYIIKDYLDEALSRVGPEETIVWNITDLNFTQDATLNRITITISSQERTLTGGGRTLNMTVTSDVYLRN
jgi:prepilin-type N-terminal cleavage/methylation domain-containing protein